MIQLYSIQFHWLENLAKILCRKNQLQTRVISKNFTCDSNPNAQLDFYWNSKPLFHSKSTSLPIQQMVTWVSTSFTYIEEQLKLCKQFRSEPTKCLKALKFHFNGSSTDDVNCIHEKTHLCVHHLQYT